MNRKVTGAMILAAGKGTRLLPLTTLTPKVLLPVNGKPLVYYIFSWLKSYGISEIALNLYHLGRNIADYVGDGSKFGVHTRYSQEEVLMGTAGGVKKLEGFFRDTFIVTYGDVLTDFNLAGMIDYHRQSKAAATIALMPVSSPQEKGIVTTGPDGRALSFVEKPQHPDKYGNLANAGIYILEPDVFRYISGGQYCDFGFDIFPAMIADDRPVYGYRIEPSAYLIDIGSQESYDRVNRDMLAGKVHIADV